VTAHWILFYDYVPDYLERRGEFRPKHFEHANAYRERGELVMAGAFGDQPNGAVLTFRTDDRSVVESFAQNDPYVKNGLVKNWTVRSWTVVIGGDA